MRIRILILSLFLLCFFNLSFLNAETTRFPVSRDLWISSAPGEENGSNGGAPRLKFKGYQEFSLLDFDLEPLRGKRIIKASLYLKNAADKPLQRVGISTISVDWNEGEGTNYSFEEGASSFLRRRNPDIKWNESDDNGTADSSRGDITSVIFGRGGSFWNNADATSLDDDWQKIDVDPKIVAARVYNLSFGFVVFDDTGTQIIRDGDAVTFDLFPNRFFYSREQNASCAPYLEVEYDDVAERDRAVASPTRLSSRSENLPKGEAIVSWRYPKDAAADVLGFIVKIDGKRVDPTLVPSPLTTSRLESRGNTNYYQTRARFPEPNKSRRVEISAVNQFGDESPARQIEVVPSSRDYANWNSLLNAEPKVVANAKKSKELPSVKNTKVAVVDEFVKFTEKGETIPPTRPSYLLDNALWNASKKTVSLSSAQNEFIGFQLVFSGDSSIKVRLKFEWDSNDSSQRPATKFYRYALVNSSVGKVVDPMLEITEGEFETRAGTDVVYCELFAPAELAPGEKRGRLIVSESSGKELELAVDLRVWNFRIPNKLSFYPEMNCYSLPENERDYYRLAQVHRTYVNRVPYSHRGWVGDGLAPSWDSEKRVFDWSDWEKRFGPYFDGSAFADLPRGAEPIEAFYLPLFENFPANIFEGFSGVNEWPDENAFSREYNETFTEGARQFASKIKEKRWNQTSFLFFLNNKMDYKRNGWSSASSPWLLDEPASYRDFTALGYFGRLVKDALARDNLSDTIQFRADISRPQWERDSLDSVMDLYVVSGDTFKEYNDYITDRRERLNRVVYTYGTTASPSESAYQPVLWSLDAWSLGADGIVPWQTIGNRQSWEEADETSLFYPAIDGATERVVPSLRLKAYRRGEQDVEYLTLALERLGRSRDELATALRERLNFKSNNEIAKTSDEDAGTISFRATDPDDLQRLRNELGRFLNLSHDNNTRRESIR